MKTKSTLFVLFLFVSSVAFAGDLARTETKNISYYAEAILDKADDYQKSQCKLDVSSPKDAEKLPVLVWFHGGGLSAGGKHVPGLLRNDRIVMVGVGYRLTPKAKFPDFLEDAAAAVAWTFAHAGEYGGDPDRIFVGGCSAGAYLSAMIGLDKRWLEPYGQKPSKLAGLVLLTGQMTTHFNVRKLLNDPRPEYLPIVDENAPMFYLSKDAPPMVLTVGDRKIEWPVRVEENALMAASLRAMKHPHVEFYENPGYDHGKMGSSPEAFEQIRCFIRSVCDKQGK